MGRASMKCLQCRKCRNERAGPFELICSAIKIVCVTCRQRDCPHAIDCDQPCKDPYTWTAENYG